MTLKIPSSTKNVSAMKIGMESIVIFQLLINAMREDIMLMDIANVWTFILEIVVNTW